MTPPSFVIPDLIGDLDNQRERVLNEMYMQDGDQERPQPTFIPTISEQTRQTLVSRLGLDTDAARAALLLSREYINPVVALSSLTESVFEGVVIHNPHFVRTILSTLNEVYGHKTGSYLDGRVSDRVPRL